MQRMSKLSIALVGAALLTIGVLAHLSDPATGTADAQAAAQPSPEGDGAVVVAVSGRVAWISPALAEGGPVERDEVLVRLESRELTAVLEHAEQAAAEAERALSRVLARVERIGALFDRGSASQAELAAALGEEKQARDALQRAWKAVAKARADVDATEVRAPISGLVIEGEVRLGEFVSRGARVARVGHETA